MLEREALPGNPCLFVVGCPRSGTTLLQRMLDNHPELAVANDTHFIPRVLEKVAPTWMAQAERGLPVPLTPLMIGAVGAYHRFHRLGLGSEQLEQAARLAKTYAGFVGGLYDAFARGNGKTLGGEKTPDYVRRIPLLHGLFPGARFRHIVRDGRDVALSAREWASEDKGPGKLELWQRDPVATCALWWSWNVEAGRRAGAVLPSGHYLEVRYERLVAEPGPELAAIASFLGLEYRPEMVSYHEGRARANHGLSAKSRWLPPTPGLRDWTSQMSPSDVQLFEALAGDTLAACGYPTNGGASSGPVHAVATRAVTWWRDWVARQRAKEERRMELER